MFNTISWQGYWTTLAITAALYYLIIFLVFYRQDLLEWLKRKKQAMPLATAVAAVPISSHHSMQQREESSPLNEAADTDFEPPEADSLEGVVYACMDECNAYFEAASGSTLAKDEVLSSLRQITSKYQRIRNTTYLLSLNELLQFQCERHCALHLSKEEVSSVWFR